MRIRLLKSMGAVAAIISVLVFLKPAQVTVAQEGPTSSVKAPAAAQVLKTPWGEPDLQGIWTDESDTPLQRPAKYANQEFFTEAQRAELDKERAALLGRDKRVERGTELDVLPQPTGNFVWPCCKRPRLARTSRWPVPEGNTIRRTLRGAPNFLLATIRRA